jgi:exodeoxyribonuclease VII small subunit
MAGAQRSTPNEDGKAPKQDNGTTRQRTIGPGAEKGLPPIRAGSGGSANGSRGFSLCAGMLNSKLAMASPAKKTEISFETAMERLEKIVEEMESGKMLLEDLLVRYEEGMKLVKVCQDRLAHAEQKIQIITRDHAGKTSVKDFAATEPPIASAISDSMEEKENDEVRLF